MKNLLRNANSDAGLPPAETTPAPPIAAAVVAKAKSPREALLEGRLKKVVKVARTLAAEKEVVSIEKQNALGAKKKVEEDLCRLQDENSQLRGFVPKPPPAKEKFSWMGYEQK